MRTNRTSPDPIDPAGTNPTPELAAFRRRLTDPRVVAQHDHLLARIGANNLADILSVTADLERSLLQRWERTHEVPPATVERSELLVGELFRLQIRCHTLTDAIDALCRNPRLEGVERLGRRLWARRRLIETLLAGQGLISIDVIHTIVAAVQRIERIVDLARELADGVAGDGERNGPSNGTIEVDVAPAGGGRRAEVDLLDRAGGRWLIVERDYPLDLDAPAWTEDLGPRAEALLTVAAQPEHRVGADPPRLEYHVLHRMSEPVRAELVAWGQRRGIDVAVRVEGEAS